MNLKDVAAAARTFPDTPPVPLLFLGHGSPMNAIEENEFTKTWHAIGASLPLPRAILCISAHWETNGTFVTAMESPPTIHDFGGFPEELSEVTYPAPGSPELAAKTKALVTRAVVELDRTWGLDHGCWSVAKHLYPDAGIPVIQMSLDRTKPARWHYELARELSPLREKGILILGSGNIVHNLGIMNWRTPGEGYDWAVAANERLKGLIREHHHDELMNYGSLGKEVQLGVPTPEHYIPLMYILGLQREGEAVQFSNDKTVYGSVAMTSVQIST
jgi:4,5-DOPA dioxygenase extradiol